MSLTVEVWEDSGAVTGTPNRGTTRQEVDNLGWKNSGLDESYPFVDYPINQPFGDDLFAVSYPKFYFFKISGSYDYAHLLQVRFIGDPEGVGNGSGYADGVRIFYKWSNEYYQPTNTLISGTMYDPTVPPVWKPLLSTLGPEHPGSWQPELIDNTTYYTPYLITQVFVQPGEWNDYGNLMPEFKLEITFKEQKTGLPGYDPQQINWSW